MRIDAVLTALHPQTYACHLAYAQPFVCLEKHYHIPGAKGRLKGLHYSPQRASAAVAAVDVLHIAPPASRRNEGLMHRDGGGTNAEAS